MTREIDYSSDLPSAPRGATSGPRAAGTLGLMLSLFSDLGPLGAPDDRQEASSVRTHRRGNDLRPGRRAR
jgi:hypothetical protein